MDRISSFLLIAFAVVLWSCQEQHQPDLPDQRKAGLAELKAAALQQRDHPDVQSSLAFWQSLLKDKRYSGDSVLSAKIQYNIAGVFYKMEKLDSVKNHMQIAWSLMEKQNGYDAEKVQLYSGLGNIAYMEQKMYQENYYYNRAAQMLMADSTIGLTPKQQTTIYFAAAQSAAQLRQFDNAFKMNRKVISLLPLLPGDHKVCFRAYSQMAVCFFRSDGSLDSLMHYIRKMEAVYRLSPDVDKARFICDRKACYYERKGPADSTLFYNRERLAMNVKDAVTNGPSGESIMTGNLYLSYAGMAGAFLGKGMVDSSAYYLKKCDEFERQYAGKLDDDHFLVYRQNKVRYLFAIGNYKAAEREQSLLLQEVKRLYEVENARAIAEMSTIFQLQAKDKSIHSLSQTVALAESKLQSNRLWLAVSTLALLLAITVLLLFYYFQRQRKLLAENEKTQLEQRLLRTQMEPHFIFNTLSALQSFVRFDEKEKSLKYLNQFGRLLRSSLQLSRDSFVPLSEEIATLDNYLSLQQMRYDDAFDYELNVDEEEDTENIYIPPMLMQPFVENSIIHGIDPNGRNGKITVDFEIRQATVLVTISDNGKGISSVEENRPHKSLSTAISKERLAMLAKEMGLHAGIEIRNGEEQGTIVMITIPFKSAAQATARGSAKHIAAQAAKFG